MAQNPRLKRFREEHLAHHNLKTSAKTLSPLEHAERHTFQIARILTENARQDKDGYSPEMETALRNLAMTLNTVSMALPNEDSEASHYDDSDRTTSREITAESEVSGEETTPTEGEVSNETATAESESTEDGAAN